MTVIIRGGTVVNADASVRADVLCEGGLIRAIGADLQAPAGCRGGRRRRRAGDAGRHRHPHAHGASLHGHGDDGRLLHRHRGRAVGRHDVDPRLRDPEPEAVDDGGLPQLERLGREVGCRLRLPRRRDLVGRERAPRHGHARQRARREQLQALHGLQERDHGRRRGAGEQLHARARARCAADRARRERRARLPAAEQARRDGARRARAAPGVAPDRRSRPRRRTARSASPR